MHSSPANAEKTLVAVATNFAHAAEQLARDYGDVSGHQVILSAGSTGKLYAQIVNGAPFDAFLAADQRRPARLETARLIAPGSRFTYAVGQLVLWSADEKTAVGAATLYSGRFRRLSIANPELAPYGTAAMEVLQSLALLDALRGRIVTGENVGQAFALVATGNAELGLIAASQLATVPRRSDDAWSPDPAHYAPIRQDAVVLQRAANNPATLGFVRYLRTDAAREAIVSLGYRVE